MCVCVSLCVMMFELIIGTYADSLHVVEGRNGQWRHALTNCTIKCNDFKIVANIEPVGGGGHADGIDIATHGLKTECATNVLPKGVTVNEIIVDDAAREKVGISNRTIEINNILNSVLCAVI